MQNITSRRAVTIFLALALAYFISTLIRAITATLAPVLVQELGLNAADLGLLAGGYFLGFAATQLPLGKWLDRYGPKRVELTFLSIAVLSCLAFSMAQSFAGLLLARVLCGVGVSACLMAPLTGYRRWYAPGNQLRANSWMLMVGAFGMVASTLPVQWLLPVMGWRPIFWILAAGLVLAMIAITWQLPGWPVPQASRSDGPPTSQGYSEIWHSRFFWRLVPLGFFSYGGMVAVQTLWATPWMVKVAGYAPQQASVGMFWLNIGMLVAFWLWGLGNPWLTRHGYTTVRLITLGMPVAWLVLVGIAWTGPALGSLAAPAWVLFCVTSTVSSQAQPAVGMAFRPELAGRALSAFNLVIFCGVFTVQWGIGLAIDALRAAGLAEVAAYQGALGLYAVCCAGAYLYFLLAKKP